LLIKINNGVADQKNAFADHKNNSADHFTNSLLFIEELNEIVFYIELELGLKNDGKIANIIRNIFLLFKKK
jgi:hypothetical protein